MIITAKFPGVCAQCSQRYAAGAEIHWSKGARPYHVTCRAAEAPQEENTNMKKSGYAEVARREIRAGKTDAEVLDALVRECGLDTSDPKKRGYPAWYRSELKRAEKLVGKAGTTEVAVGVSADDLVTMISEAVASAPGGNTVDMVAVTKMVEAAVEKTGVAKLIDAAVAKRVRPSVIEVKVPGKKETSKV